MPKTKDKAIDQLVTTWGRMYGLSEDVPKCGDVR